MANSLSWNSLSSIENYNYVNVYEYFQSSYPCRSKLSNLFFRRGERQRISQVNHWLANMKYSSLLDAGCGDGYFLSRILNEKIKLIRLEDLNPANINVAKIKLGGMAQQLEAAATDSFLSRDNKQYDVVLAIGLLDYYSNWPQLLRILMSRARRVLIFDCPKAQTFHSLVRKLWLLLHKVNLATITENDINNYFDKIDCPIKIAKLSSSWMIRIERAC